MTLNDAPLGLSNGIGGKKLFEFFIFLVKWKTNACSLTFTMEEGMENPNGTNKSF
jgi:hypothetical protein